MRSFLQLAGVIILAYSVAGIVLHALSRFQSFGHHCEMLLIPAGENHLQVFTAAAAVAAVIFLVARALKKRRLKTPA